MFFKKQAETAIDNDGAAAMMMSRFAVVGTDELVRTREAIEKDRTANTERFATLEKAFYRLSAQLQLLLIETGYEIADVPAHMEIRKRAKGK